MRHLILDFAWYQMSETSAEIPLGCIRCPVCAVFSTVLLCWTGWHSEERRKHGLFMWDCSSSYPECIFHLWSYHQQFQRKVHFCSHRFAINGVTDIQVRPNFCNFPWHTFNVTSLLELNSNSFWNNRHWMLQVWVVWWQNCPEWS